MAQQIARARSLALAQIKGASATLSARRASGRAQVNGGLLEQVSGITRWIQELGAFGGDRPSGEIEPWQPLGGRKGVPKGAKEYDNVYVEGGRVWAPYRNGTRRMLGYTPTAAKKKFKTKRRRKRLTKRDMYILSVVEKTGNTSLIHML